MKGRPAKSPSEFPVHLQRVDPEEMGLKSIRRYGFPLHRMASPKLTCYNHVFFLVRVF